MSHPSDSGHEFGAMLAYLQAVYKFGSESSPVEYYLEAMIDLSLKLANDSQEERPFLRRNPRLELPEGKIDALNNQLSIRIPYPKEKLNSEGSAFFYFLASFFSTLRRHKNFQKAFRAFLDSLNLLQPPTLSGKEPMEKDSVSHQTSAFQRRSAFRRRRIKREKGARSID